MSCSVVGVGIVQFGVHERPAHQLAAEATLAALEDAGLGTGDVDAVYGGASLQGPAFAQRVVVGTLGMHDTPVTNVENICASGASALHLGAIAIEAGAAETVLVVGAEKLSGRDGGALSVDPDGYYEEVGMILPALYSMRASRYLDRFGGDGDDFAEVAVKNRANGARAPHAYQRQALSREDVLSSRLIADYISLYQVCRNADGAAALVLAGDSAIRAEQRKRAVPVLAHAQATGGAFGRQRDVMLDEVTPRAAEAAFEEAGIGPGDIDVAEVHDATTIGEILNCEALGLLPTGAGLDATLAGETAVGGRIAVNPDGGLIARGHPLGATGAAMAVEIVSQLRNEAEGRQVQRPEYGLTHTTGGGVFGIETAAACNVILFGSPQDSDRETTPA